MPITERKEIVVEFVRVPMLGKKLGFNLSHGNLYICRSVNIS